MQGTILAIHVGRPQSFGSEGVADPHDRPWTTGIFKHAVAGPVWVGRLNIEGDAQADLKHHGGVDKAVLAYSADHYPLWRDQLGIPELGAGGFGENLTVTGMTEQDVAIGDRWRAGDVLFEISQPRQPCWKLGRRWRRSDLPKLVVKSARSGWYLRVLEEGMLAVGDVIELVERPHPDWTVARASAVLFGNDCDAEKRQLASLPQLSRSWKEQLESLVSR